MSDRKRKAAICCLIAASFLAVERSKKRKRERRNEYVSKHFNSLMDADNRTDCDQEEEEESYKIQDNTNIAIKVEPGLTDDVYEDDLSLDEMKYSSTECHTVKEEILDTEHLDSLIDINNTSIKQEQDYSNLNSTNSGIEIKVEPCLNEDDDNNYLSFNCTKDPLAECSQLKEVSFDGKTKIQRVTTSDKDQEFNDRSTGIKCFTDINEMRDDCQLFGEFVARKLQNLKSDDNRRKLKRVIKEVIAEISESEEQRVDDL